MRRFVIAILVGLLLVTAVGFAQDTTPPAAPAPPSNAAGSAVPTSLPPGVGTAPPTPFKICAKKHPAQPCATPPRALKYQDPDYSDEAKQIKFQGTVVLWVVVGADGLPGQIRVARALGHGLDEQAIKAVKKWKFKPGTFDGRPVPVQVNIEVDFRLY